MADRQKDHYKEIQNSELRLWLKTHNSSVKNELTERHLEALFHSNIAQDLKHDNNPLETFSDIIFFSSCIDKSRPTHSKFENPVFSTTGAAVRNVLQHRHNHERFSAGMSMGTLLTEHRRKVILKALTDKGSINETKQNAEEKLSACLAQRHPSVNTLPSDEQVKFPSPSARPATMSSISNANAQSNGAHQRLAVAAEKLSTNPQFTPQWEHYSTMRTRWRDIRPQVARLETHTDCLVAVCSADQTVVRTAGGSSVAGNLADAELHCTMQDRRSRRKDNISYQTNRLILKSLHAEHKVYVPVHSVKY